MWLDMAPSWHHHGAMDLTPYVDALRQDLLVAAEPGGPDAHALADRLTAPLESATRLVLLDALSAAAGEITRDLAPGSVDLRLRGREPSFVVTLPPADPTYDEVGAAPTGALRWADPARPSDDDDSAMTRINLRLPQDLKDRVEDAAARSRALGQRLAGPLRHGRPARRRRRRRRLGLAGRPRRRPVHRLGPLATTRHSPPPFHHHSTDTRDQQLRRFVMPTFQTSEPITANIELAVGDARIAASDRDDTVVEVRPTNPDNDADVRAAAETRVEFSPASGQLVVRGPKQRGLEPDGQDGVDRHQRRAADRLPGRGLRRGRELPAARPGRLVSAQDLGRSHPDRADRARSTPRPAWAPSRSNAVAGDADVRTSSGRLRIGEIDGAAVIKNSNGDSWVGDVHGDLRINAANGDIAVDRARSSVVAATANGDVRVGDVSRGSASLKTALGQIEVGVHAGSAALLDAHTSMGRVRNEMDAADQPGAGDETVEVRAPTSFGDILIRRAGL